MPFSTQLLGGPLDGLIVENIPDHVTRPLTLFILADTTPSSSSEYLAPVWNSRPGPKVERISEVYGPWLAVGYQSQELSEESYFTGFLPLETLGIQDDRNH